MGRVFQVASTRAGLPGRTASAPRGRGHARCEQAQNRAAEAAAHDPRAGGARGQHAFARGLHGRGGHLEVVAQAGVGGIQQLAQPGQVAAGQGVHGRPHALVLALHVAQPPPVAAFALGPPLVVARPCVDVALAGVQQRQPPVAQLERDGRGGQVGEVDQQRRRRAAPSAPRSGPAARYGRPGGGSPRAGTAAPAPTGRARRPAPGPAPRTARPTRTGRPPRAGRCRSPRRPGNAQLRGHGVAEGLRLRRPGPRGHRDPLLDGERQRQPAVVVGVLADQVHPARCEGARSRPQDSHRRSRP